MDIDEGGPIWVMEGVNYHSTFKPWGVLQPAGDRIVILEDTNREGVAGRNFAVGRPSDRSLELAMI